MFPPSGLSATTVALAVWTMAACAPSSGPQAVTEPPVAIIAESDTIVGKAVTAPVVRLLTASHQLYRLDLQRQQVVAVGRLEVDEGAQVWGLAETAGGSLWTLLGFRQLARVDDTGRLLEKIELANPALALYGWHDGLIVQEATLQSDVPVLLFVRPGSTDRWPFGNLQRRGFATRPETLAGNLVSCGSTAGDEIPCWFSHTLLVHRIGPDGVTRVSRAVGLGLEPLAAGDGAFEVDSQVVRPRPIRDAYIDDEGALWLLTMKPPSQAAEMRAVGEQLARYTAGGELARAIPLTEPARIILGFVRDQVLLLSVTGRFLAVPRS